MSQLKPRYIAGSVTPLGADRHPMPQPEPLLPPEVMTVSSSIDIDDYTEAGVNEAMARRYWSCVDALAAQGAQSITLAGFPIAAQLGRARVLELARETSARTGAYGDSHAEASVDAMRHLGLRRIAIASRWSETLNRKLVAYLEEAGFEVLAVTGLDQGAAQAFSMSIEEGVKLAFQLGREAMRKAPDANGLLMPGGAWRSLAAVPILEADFGKPVVTNPIAQVWRLMARGVAPPVQGWGRLLAHP